MSSRSSPLARRLHWRAAMHLTRLIPVPAVSALLLAACGGTSVAPGEPLPDDRREALCADLCDHASACGDPVDEACAAECADALAHFRGDVVEDALGCILDLSCGQDDEPCWEDAVDRAPRTAAWDGFVEACGAWALRCDEEPCADDDYAIYYTDDLLRDLTACFDDPCEAVSACFDAAFPDL